MFPPSPLIKRSLVAFAVAVASLAPLPARAAGEAAALERTRQQIAEIKKRLAAAKGQAAAIQAEVSALDRQIGSLNKQIRDGEHDISELESDIRSAQAQIAEMEAKYLRASQASNERARQLYKTGPAETLSQLLSAKSMLEFVRLQFWWEISSELDGKTMLNAARLKADLAERKEGLMAIKADLAAQKQWLQSRKGLIADARGQKNSALQGVQADIASQESHIRTLEAQSKALTASLKTSLSRSSGGAVSRSGFAWPLNGRVTSRYGYRSGGFHSGIDIDGNTGDPIRASKAGTIAGVNCGSGYGICTIIDHGEGVATLYAHMTRKAVSGGSVSQGQVIGYVGCTGSCTGSHLHFEVRVNGSPRDPMGFLP